MPVSRKRSCASCRVAKTRCSLTFPICSRCKSKHMDCDYADNGPNQESRTLEEGNVVCGDDLQHRNISVVARSLQMIPTSSEDTADPTRPVGNVSFRESDDILAVLDPALPMPGFGRGSQRQLAQDQDNVSDFANSEVNGVVQANNFPEVQVVRNNSYGLTTTWPQYPKLHPMLLHPKQSSTLGSLLISKHLLSVFDSYPQLLCGEEGHPPFIHHRYSGHKEAVHVQQALAICLSICCMYFKKNPASMPFIWQNVVMEQKRLHKQLHDPVSNIYTAFCTRNFDPELISILHCSKRACSCEHHYFLSSHNSASPALFD
jgi:hypothetical protein